MHDEITSTTSENAAASQRRERTRLSAIMQWLETNAYSMRLVLDGSLDTVLKTPGQAGTPYPERCGAMRVDLNELDRIISDLRAYHATEGGQ